MHSQSQEFLSPRVFNIISVKKDTQAIILQMLTTELIPRKSKKKNIYFQEK